MFFRRSTTNHMFGELFLGINSSAKEKKLATQATLLYPPLCHFSAAGYVHSLRICFAAWLVVATTPYFITFLCRAFLFFSLLFHSTNMPSGKSNAAHFTLTIYKDVRDRSLQMVQLLTHLQMDMQEFLYGPLLIFLDWLFRVFSPKVESRTVPITHRANRRRPNALWKGAARLIRIISFFKSIV